MQKVVISQNINTDEINQLVSLHTKILHESVLNKFGKKFLTISYRSIVNDAQNIVLTARINSKIVGFLVATTNSSQFYNNIIQSNFLSLSWEIIKSGIIHPRLFIETIIWTFIKSKKRRYAAELQFIAVATDLQSRGIGKKLLTKLNLEFRQKKIRYYCVGTKSHNKRSNSFYLKNHFKLKNKRSILGESFNYYLSPNISS